jgi:hypothetical protein
MCSYGFIWNQSIDQDSLQILMRLSHVRASGTAQFVHNLWPQVVTAGDSYGFLWIHMDSYGFLWISMDSYGFLWIPIDSYVFLWIHMESIH